MAAIDLKLMKYMNSMLYPLKVCWRFIIAFGVGYLCTYYLCISLTSIFAKFLAKSEAIFLAGFLSLIFYTGFILILFCWNSLKKVSFFSALLLFILFLSQQFQG